MDREKFVSSCLLLIEDGSHHHGADANDGSGSIDETTYTLLIEHGEDPNHGGGSTDKTAGARHME